MLRLVAVFACARLVLGLPDPPAPVGYSYTIPPTSYSAPSTSYGAPSIAYSVPSTSYGASSFSQSAGGYRYKSYSHTPLVQKHIYEYVHVPPPEPQEHKAPKILSVAQPQKHYKIIFIKAPSPPKPTAPVIPIQPQNEEKTLVYVLVKKPEEQADIVIPTPAPTQPSKPEVYFIKYQTQKEAEVQGEVVAAGGASRGSDFTINVGGGEGEENSEGDISSQLVSEGSDSDQYDSVSTQYGPPGYVAGTPH